MSRIAILSGLVSSGIGSSLNCEHASLLIWSVSADDTVSRVALTPSIFVYEVEDWKIMIPAALKSALIERRTLSLPNETGGPLLGTVDFDARAISVVHSPAPPVDSIGKPTTFIRGTRGLKRTIEATEQRSGGQVRYIGEWHSHPRGASATPSYIDLVQIRDLSVVMDIDGLPAISLILSDNGLRILIGSVQ